MSFTFQDNVPNRSSAFAPRHFNRATRSTVSRETLVYSTYLSLDIMPSLLKIKSGSDLQ